MNRSLLALLSPLLPVALGIAALQMSGDPKILATLLLAAASVLGLGLGLRIRAIPAKRNYLKGFSYYLLGLFNLVVITTIIVEVLALFSLIGLIQPHVTEKTTSLVWSLAALQVALQTGVIIERRINSPPPDLSKPLRQAVTVITAFNALLWLNALLIHYTNLLFVTRLSVAPDQAVYLLLTGLTLQAVAAMIAFRIPTLFELVFMRPTGPGRLLALTSATPIIFTLAFTGLVLVASLAFVFAADQVLHLGHLLPHSVGLRLLLVFPVTLITFFLVAGFLSYQSSRTRYRMKMDPQQKMALGIGIPCALVTLVLLEGAVRLFLGYPVTLAGVPLSSRLWVEFLVAALLVATGPIGFYLQHRHRRIRYMEESLSDFLRDMAETSRAGLPLHQSLQTAAEKDYGPLTPEIKKMAVQCSWGLSFAEAFRRFGARTRSRLVQRAANLVVETSTSGGNTGDVLAATAVDIHQQKSLDEDRRVAMSTYIAVIYVVFFVFVAVLGVLSALFLPQLFATTKAAATAGASQGLFAAGRVDLRGIKDAYFQALLVQAAGNGMIAGIIRDGSLSSGLKHVFILVLCSYGAYRLLFA